jgi:hypothetical protein
LKNKQAVRVFQSVKTPSTTVRGRKALILHRILDFLSAWDQKQKDWEIERLLARSGGRFTDALERRILQREMTSDWSVHRQRPSSRWELCGKEKNHGFW